MKTKNPDFSSVAVDPFIALSNSDMKMMENYKHNLIDILINKALPNHRSDELLSEIKKVNAFIKSFAPIPF